MTLEGMKLGHFLFLTGIAVALLGFLIAIPGLMTLNVLLAFLGGAVSFLGSILVAVGIHIFMRDTINEASILERIGQRETKGQLAPGLGHFARARLRPVLRILVLSLVGLGLVAVLLLLLR